MRKKGRREKKLEVTKRNKSAKKTREVTGQKLKTKKGVGELNKKEDKRGTRGGAGLTK